MLTRKISLIGFFVTVSVAILIWGINYLNGNNLFVKDQTYYAVYNKVNGLVETAPVFINGYQIGQVRTLNFHGKRADRLIAKITISSDIKLPRKSIAEIYAVDLMGTKGIRIIPGHSDKFHNTGDTLKSKFSQEFSDKVLGQIDPLKIKIEQLLGSVDTLVNNTRRMVDKKNKQNLGTVLNNLAQISKNLNVLVDKNQTSISQSIARIDTFSRTLEKNRKHIDTTLQNMASLSDSLKESNIKSSLLAMNDISRAIQKRTGSAGSFVYNDTLYQNLENSTKELEKLLRDIQENPKKYVHFSLFGK